MNFRLSLRKFQQIKIPSCITINRTLFFFSLYTLVLSTLCFQCGVCFFLFFSSSKSHFCSASKPLWLYSWGIRCKCNGKYSKKKNKQLVQIFFTPTKKKREKKNIKYSFSLMITNHFGFISGCC